VQPLLGAAANCRSPVVAPDGQIAAQTELREERLLVADIDIDLATRATFRDDLDGCAPLLFGDTVRPDEYRVARP
jgi:apolipoprotein N-acyltransferase